MARRRICRENGSAPCNTASGATTGCSTTRSSRRLALAEKPQLIIAGGSAYPRFIDFPRIRAGGRCGGGVFHGRHGAFRRPGRRGIVSRARCRTRMSSPRPRTRRCAGRAAAWSWPTTRRSAKKINSAVFPGLQGGPLMHVIAAKAVAFGEALRPEFRLYQKAVVDNARVLAATLQQQGLAIVTGGTDCHLMLVDLRSKRVTGKAAEASLERARITANKNAIPFDPEKPTITSGVRLGTPAATTRGFGTAEFREVGTDDRRGARRAGAVQRRIERRRSRGRLAGAGAVRALPAVSRAVGRHALPVLRLRRHPGEGQPPQRGRRGDPPAAVLRQLRPALHHDRADPTARTHRHQVGWAAGAVRPREAGALDPHRAAQAADPGGANRAHRQRHRAAT